ncbi:distal tail protein Dit [Planomicrobium sp. MB-3u-38]|uniref:distal tail protein Dit n=1 Tax=Planomicrobium sp. MB-3u-38 TaxID=2058318 RepID=UPI000C7D66E6|nr:distal tail protein Dit [Planomicrobium sp. MB-3u-38]PKH09866.1 hypothetical protein CXF70_11685 [Planomicrobium sp. MB-3u-38]
MHGRGMSFAGEKCKGVSVISLKVGRIAPIRRKTIMVPGLPGGKSRGYETGVRPITAIVELEASSHDEWLDMLDELTGMLVQEKPQSLEFEQESGRMYMAELDGDIETREMNSYGQVTLNFICADPHVYGSQNIDYFQNGIVTIANNGNAEVSPVYEIDVKEDITHLDIISDKAYFRIGEPAPISSPVYNRTTLILNDTMQTMLGWSVASTVDNGYVGGTMIATQAGFEAQNFGEAIEPHAWQGPSVRRSLPEPVQNFQADIPIELLNVSKETGMIEVYFLDAFSNTVAKIGMEDVWRTIKRNQSKFQLGNVDGRKVEKHQSADYPNNWNNFKGIIRLWRDGNRFRPYFALVNSKGVHKEISNWYVYTDKANEYMNEITQIQVAIRKWPGTSTSQADMRIGGLKVWRLNDPPEGIPVMAKKDDKIVIDTIEGVVMINGEVREDLKDHFSDYFDLPKGRTTLVMQPDDKVEGRVITRERSR